MFAEELPPSPVVGDESESLNPFELVEALGALPHHSVRTKRYFARCPGAPPGRKRKWMKVILVANAISRLGELREQVGVGIDGLAPQPVGLAEVA